MPFTSPAALTDPAACFCCCVSAGADNPTYLKDPNGCGIGDDKTFMLMNAFQIFLLMQLGRGLYNMANGVGKS